MAGSNTLKYEYSLQFRTIVADHGIITIAGDQVAQQVSLTLSHLTPKPISEQTKARTDGQIELISNAVPEIEIQRTMEFTILMRPDHAKNLAIAIRKSMQNLTPEMRKLYKITDADLESL